MSADAVIMPARATLREAVFEAVAQQHEPTTRLYTDGKRLAWLPRRLPGWFRLAVVEKAA